MFVLSNQSYMSFNRTIIHPFKKDGDVVFHQAELESY